MLVSASQASRVRWLVALLFIGVCNALIRPIIDSAQQLSGLQWLANAFGVNPVIWIATLLGLVRLWQEPLARIAVPAPVLMVCLMLWLLPSATLAWLGIALLCSSVLTRNEASLPATLRAGLLILLAAAMREPLSQLLLKIAITPLLESDAWLVATLADLVMPGYQRLGNLVINPQGFRLVILTGCTSYGNLSLVLLLWLSLTLFFIRRWFPVYLIHGLVLLLITVVVNILRLVVMSFGESYYLFLHDGDGAAIYAVLLTALPLFASRWSIRHAPSPDVAVTGIAVAAEPDAQEHRT